MDMETLLGFTFRDKATGFCGEASGFYGVLNGRRMVRRVRLVRGGPGAAVRVTRWFDIERLEQVYQTEPAAAHAASS